MRTDDRRPCGCPLDYHLADCPLLTDRGLQDPREFGAVEDEDDRTESQRLRDAASSEAGFEVFELAIEALEGDLTSSGGWGIPTDLEDRGILLEQYDEDLKAAIRLLRTAQEIVR